MTEREQLAARNKELAEISAGERMGEILAEPVVREAFAALEQRYTSEFKIAVTSEQRTLVWVRMRALTDLAVELRAVHDRGVFSTETRKNRIAAEDREAARIQRKVDRQAEKS